MRSFFLLTRFLPAFPFLLLDGGFHISFVDRRIIYVPLSFSTFLGDVRREFMQRLSAALHGTLGSHLRDALQEGNLDVVACLFLPPFLFCLVVSIRVSLAFSL
jgi:hypothetical protein